ncbi:MAG TPA: acylphosphatase [Pseudomonadales bacterium]
MHVCKKSLLSGVVQGVCFRASTQEKARELGLVGCVRNLPDGRVEAIYCGLEAEVALLEAWLSQGPEAATVDEVKTERVEWRFFEDFMISR